MEQKPTQTGRVLPSVQSSTPAKPSLNTIKLSEGSGGREMQILIDTLTKEFNHAGWRGVGDDSAHIEFNGTLCFTTDSFVITPLFFPGGNIGTVAFCGTVNDLAVRGADPIGLSLSLVIEEGFSKDDLLKIVQSIGKYSRETQIPIVTGDTKVMEKGSLDKLIITTSGVGKATTVLDKPLSANDVIIVSGSIAEHGAALIAKRFELQTDIESCCKPLHMELRAIRHLIKQAKDITRGGLASILNEIADKNNVQLTIHETKVPLQKQVRALTEILGLDVFHLPCEGRFVCVSSQENAPEVLRILQTFHPLAAIVGDIQPGKGVVLHTAFGRRAMHMPTGNIVPRIC